MSDWGRVGIILNGGGFKCAFQAGALLAIEEGGLKIQKIQGVSAGAISGAGYAASGAQLLIDNWHHAEQEGPAAVFSSWDAVKHIVRRDTALYNDAGLENALNRLDMRKVVDSPIEFEVVVWNESQERLEVFKNHDGRSNPAFFQKIIKASLSFPGLFNPVIINKQIFSDGGEIVPDTFKDFDTVFVIDTGQPNLTVDPSVLKWNQRLLRRFNSLVDSCMEKSLKSFVAEHKFKLLPAEDGDTWAVARHLREFLNEFWLTLVGLDKSSDKRLVIINPYINIDTLRLDYFQKGDISKAIEYGYRRAKEILLKL